MNTCRNLLIAHCKSILLSCKVTLVWPVHRQRKEPLARSQLLQRANANEERRKRWTIWIRVKKRFHLLVKMKWKCRLDWSTKSYPTRSSIFSSIISTGTFFWDRWQTDTLNWLDCFSMKSRLYLDLFTQRVLYCSERWCFASSFLRPLSFLHSFTPMRIGSSSAFLVLRSFFSPRLKGGSYKKKSLFICSFVCLFLCGRAKETSQIFYKVYRDIGTLTGNSMWGTRIQGPFTSKPHWSTGNQLKSSLLENCCLFLIQQTTEVPCSLLI